MQKLKKKNDMTIYKVFFKHVCVLVGALYTNPTNFSHLRLVHVSHVFYVYSKICSFKRKDSLVF